MRDRLLDALAEAQRRGFLGPGPAEEQLRHAEAFARIVGEPDGPFLDLGSGAGLPGLAVALADPTAHGALLDSQRRRVRWLEQVTKALGLADRIRVVDARAEEAARDEALRGHFALVTARSFGPPAVTAECAAGFLRRGGRLMVSEPPDSTEQRWPAQGLAELGLQPPEIRHRGGVTVAVLTATGEPDDRWPRRTGIPRKRPLW